MASSEEKLRKILEEIAKKEQYEQNNIAIKPISSAGVNFTAALYVATVSDPPKPDLNLFIKVANITEELRKTNESMAKLYTIEIKFYTEVAIEFEKIYNKNNVPVEDRMVIPKYYGHNSNLYEEALVLENLEARGFVNFDRMTTFNWDFAAAAVTQLAKLHALGLAFKKENPLEFEKIANQFQCDNYYSSNETVAYMTRSVQVGIDAVSNDCKSKVQEYFDTNDRVKNILLFMVQSKKTLIHGNFRTSNLMHKRLPDKLEVIPLDFQTLKMGNPVIDLLYFIFCGSDEEFRRLHYHRLLDHYFTQLTLALRQLNIDVEDVYPKKEYDYDLNEKQPFGLMIGLIMTSIITVAPDDAPTLTSPASLQVKANRLASGRINGIVRDFVKWGVL